MNGDDPTIWCGNLAPDVTDEHLYELFLQAGPVNRVTIPKDKEGRRRNYGFVSFKHAISIPYALELFRDVCLFREPLKLQNRAGSTVDNRQVLADYNQLATSPGNFDDVRNGYNVRGDPFTNRRQNSLGGNQRSCNYDTREIERFNNRDNRRDGESRDMFGRQGDRRFSDDRSERDSYGSERSQRDAYDRMRGQYDFDRERNHREGYDRERGQREGYDRERTSRNAYDRERTSRDGYDRARSSRDGHDRDRIQHDTPPSWLGKSSRDVQGNGSPWSPNHTGGNISSNYSSDRSSVLEDIGRKIPQRTKMVLPKPTQQQFMTSAGILQMNAHWPREK